jgi:hypothetical protein
MSNPDAVAVGETLERYVFHWSAPKSVSKSSVVNDTTTADVDAMVAVERARGDEMRGEWGLPAGAKERIACEERLVTMLSAACIVGLPVHDGGPYAR